jgi:hypothetical protein
LAAAVTVADMVTARAADMVAARVQRRLPPVVVWVAAWAAAPPRHHQCMTAAESTTIFRSKSDRYAAKMIRHSIWVADFLFWGKY